MHGEPTRYFIIEHPSRGVLKDLEETESGKQTGRWSWSGSRTDGMRFVTVAQAQAARLQLRPARIQEQADIRCSQWERDTLFAAWPVVA